MPTHSYRESDFVLSDLTTVLENYLVHFEVEYVCLDCTEYAEYEYQISFSVASNPFFIALVYAGIIPSPDVFSNSFGRPAVALAYLEGHLEEYERMRKDGNLEPIHEDLDACIKFAKYAVEQFKRHALHQKGLFYEQWDKPSKNMPTPNIVEKKKKVFERCREIRRNQPY